MMASVIECWCCGRREPHWARGLCNRCYRRWQRRGFTGPGPGEERIAYVDRARGVDDVITAMSASRAAEKLGISPRTVVRYRAALRRAS